MRCTYARNIVYNMLCVYNTQASFLYGVYKHKLISFIRIAY